MNPLECGYTDLTAPSEFARAQPARKNDQHLLTEEEIHGWPVERRYGRTVINEEGGRAPETYCL